MVRHVNDNRNLIGCLREEKDLIKREKFKAIQAKGGVIDNGKDVVDNVIEKLSECQLIIYKMIRKSVADGVVETASSIANKIKLSSRTIQRDLTRLKDLNVI